MLLGAAAPAMPADWMSLGAGRGTDPDLFFPIGPLGPAQQQIAQAKAVCAACPVRAACLGYALEAGQRAGIWGGTTEDEHRFNGPVEYLTWDKRTACVHDGKQTARCDGGHHG